MSAIFQQSHNTFYLSPLAADTQPRQPIRGQLTACDARLVSRREAGSSHGFVENNNPLSGKVCMFERAHGAVCVLALTHHTPHTTTFHIFLFENKESAQRFLTLAVHQAWRHECICPLAVFEVTNNLEINLLIQISEIHQLIHYYQLFKKSVQKQVWYSHVIFAAA